MKSTNKKMRKILSTIICLALIMSYAPMTSIIAVAADHTCIDEDEDHWCDICDLVRVCCDKNNDCICDLCYSSVMCKDADHDHFCDVCGLRTHLDDNGDQKCDGCGKYIIVLPSDNVTLTADENGNKYFNGTKYTGELIIHNPPVINYKRIYITIESGEHTVDLSKGSFGALTIKSGTKLNLTIDGECEITANIRKFENAIKVEENAELLVTRASTGTLLAKGGYNDGLFVAGKVTIEGGNISFSVNGDSKSYDSGAGVTGELIITGGNILFEGKYGAAISGNNATDIANSVKIAPVKACGLAIKETKDSEEIIGSFDSLANVEELVSGDKYTSLYIYELEHTFQNGFCVKCDRDYEPAKLNANGFYEIDNAGNLFWFAEQVNEVGNREIKGVLTDDIDLENRPWTPIGTTGENNNNFRGVFDGQGHIITGLNVTGTKSGIGFFGEVRTGTVENFTIYGEVTVPGKYTYAGGVIGSTCGLNIENDLERNGATIRNIKSFVNLTLNAHGVGRVGGFVGYANHETLIENCEWYGIFDLGGYRAEAGVAGFLGRVQENSEVTVRNCGAYGTVKTNYKKDDYNGSKDIFVCGFLGWSVDGSNSADFTDTVIENCLFAGNVELGENITDQIDYSAFGCLSEIKSITNCYYLGENGLPGVNNNSAYRPSATELVSVDESQLSSGEVAYLLQSGNTEQVWGQQSNIEGSLPILTDNELYKVVEVGETGNYSVANVGDTNGDGTVDVTDYQTLVNRALADDHGQIETASYDDIVKYDIDGNGYINVLDASIMDRMINGHIIVEIYAVGDYDLNGKAFEEADIKAIKHAIENPEKLATYKKYASDINGDGKLDENDLTVLTAKYGEVTGAACADNVKVYYRWGNKYSTCTATAMCTLCGEKIATEIVNTTSETLSELTCTQDGKIKYTAIFANELFGTKVTEIVIKTKGHNWGAWETEIPASTLSAGKEKRICSVCTNEEERVIDKLNLDSRIVAYYTVVDDKVINLVDGKEMEDAVVDDDGYFKGGEVKLPSTYEKASIEAVMIYNRLSTDSPVGNGLSYYGGTFLFTEAVNPSNWGFIKTPFGGGQIGTNFILRPSLNYNKRVMSDGESYWCLAFDKNESTHALQINDDYVEKTHWSNYINKTFTLSAEHQFKKFVVYSDKLTKEDMADHFSNGGISLNADTNTIIGRVNNGITGLGSAFAFTKTGQYGLSKWYDTSTKAGNYSVNDGNGMVLNYTITDYVEPDLGIDHSKYESVHIIKKPEVLPIGYKYALSAVPYPFNVNHNGISDQYDVSWKSSDETIALVIDGMVVPQKTGTVTITATLRGTEMSDSCTIKIVDKNVKNDISVKISANYISENGNSFSESDYVMTTNAIYDAISEAYVDGYNHVIFPEIDFYAVPTETEFYIPSGMTVEFPEGSAFHMMPSEKAKTEGYVYFRMGWGWWSCAIPTETASVEKDDNGNILAYYCRNSHLIIDKYYGEFYEEDATMNELYSGAQQYHWNCNLLSIGKRAEFCSVEVREANCPTGFFIAMGGKGNSELVNGQQGSIAANEFVSGWLNDNGELVENSNWISTNDFYLVSKAANGMDTLHEYYIGNWEHNLVTATQHLYDILWYDGEYNLIGANRWQYVDEGYSNKPEDAVYFKLSIQQSELPTGTNEYVRICPDESSRFCEIKNTNVINGSAGLASVIGATEACWIHDNYVSGDGLLYGLGRSLDLEDGWAGMRGTIIERNIFKKYAYSGSSEYRGPDSGALALSSGYNTFIISNYIGSLHQSNSNVANTHIINNVVHTLCSTFDNGNANDIRPKIYAHTYYNILGQKSNEISSNGVNYYYGNTIVPTVNLW